MAENDIDLQEISKSNTFHEQRLKKMKSKIEAMQLNLTKNKGMKNSMGSSTFSKDGVNLYNLRQQQYEHKHTSPSNYINGLNNFDFNSNVYKHLSNESQAIMENGSAVSNYSSISNINKILNQPKSMGMQKPFQVKRNFQNDDLNSQIDKLLNKVKQQHKLPIKSLQKSINSKSIYKREIDEIEQSFEETITPRQYKTSNEYNEIINKIKNKQPQRRQYKDQREDQREKFSNSKQKFQSESVYSKTHHPKISSGSIFKSNYEQSSQPQPQTYRTTNNYPPLPPSSTQKLKESDAVERQKNVIKQSLKQYRELDHYAPNHSLDKSDIDFQLSDDQDHQNKESRKKELLEQKQRLTFQLKGLEKEIKELQQELK